MTGEEPGGNDPPPSEPGGEEPASGCDDDPFSSDSLYDLVWGGMSGFVKWAVKFVRYVLCKVHELFFDTLNAIVDWLLAIFDNTIGAALVFSGAGPAIRAANYYTPMSEAFLMGTACVVLRLSLTAFRWVLKFIPTIG